MHGLNRVAVTMGVGAAIAWAMVAFSVAQTATLPATETQAHQTVPEADPSRASGSSTEPLSDKLDRSGGVIKPPSGVDPAMSQSPPAIAPHSTPEIPPPGTPGGESGVKPK